MIRRETNMRLLVLIPNSGMTANALQSRQEMLSLYSSRDTEIVVECISGGPKSIESRYEEVIAGRYILERIIKAEQEGFNIVVIYCASDPVVQAAREISSIPIIAPGYTSIMIAQDLGYRYSIITVLDEMIVQNEEKVRAMGFDPTRCISVRSLDIPVLQLREDMDKTYRALVTTCRKCIEEDGAHCIVLACMGMSGLGTRLQEELGIPVLDPAMIAIQYAELIYHCNLVYSKHSYPYPSYLKRT